MKRSARFFLGAFIGIITLATLLAAGGFYWGTSQFYKEGPLRKNIVIEIPSGSSLSRIAHMLDEAGAIENPLVFKVAARLFGKHRHLKAGEYEFRPRMGAAQILEKIHMGDVVVRRLTIPEGLTSWEVVQRLNAVEELSGQIEEIPPEGTLLPETYDYQKGESRVAVIRRMQDSMRETLDKLWIERNEELPVTSKEEAVILASVIEKETGKAKERRKVAGVFVNRLKKNMLLQTDPTVIYALTNGRPENEGQGPLGRRLLRKDLQYDSPYNTYLYPGLPPGPIANPGRAAIEAALNPAQHNYLYFVADGTGGHAFAKTLAEHNRNAALWRQIRRERTE